MPTISNRKQLDFYIKADLMMSKGVFKRGLNMRIKEFFAPDYILRYIKVMRKYNYYYHKRVISKKTDLCFGVYVLFEFLYHTLYHRLGLKLGFSIGFKSFGYGLLIPHYGDVVVGANEIGNYAVLLSGICISGNGKTIGDGLYMSTGAKITSKLVLGDNVTVAANSVVTKSFPEGNVLLVGMPAVVKKTSLPWYERDGVEYKRRHDKIEELKKQLNL